MKRVKINSKTVGAAFSLIIAKRGLFLIMFAGVLFLYTFNIIYNNAYLKLKYADYSDSSMISDGKRESIAIGKITDSLEKRNVFLNEGINKKYVNVFIYADSYDKEGVGGRNDSTSSVLEPEITASPDFANENGSAADNPETVPRVEN